MTYTQYSRGKFFSAEAKILFINFSEIPVFSHNPKRVKGGK